MSLPAALPGEEGWEGPAMVLGALKGAGSQLPGAQEALEIPPCPEEAPEGDCTPGWQGPWRHGQTRGSVKCSSENLGCFARGLGSFQVPSVATFKFGAFNSRSIFFCLFALAGLGIHHSIP